MNMFYNFLHTLFVIWTIIPCPAVPCPQPLHLGSLKMLNKCIIQIIQMQLAEQKVKLCFISVLQPPARQLVCLTFPFSSRKPVKGEGVKCRGVVSFFVISHPFTPGEMPAHTHTHIEPTHSPQCTKNIK